MYVFDCDVGYVCCQGYVRFQEEGAAKKAKEEILKKGEKSGGGAKLCGADTELRVLEG